MEWIRSDLPDLPLFTCLIQLSGTDEGHISDDTIWKALYTNAEEFKKLAKYGTTCPVLSLSKSSMDGPRALRVPRGSGEGLKTRCRAIPQMRISVEQLHVESTDCVETNSQDEKTVEDMRWLAELNAKQNPSAMLTNLGVSPSNPVTGSTRGRSPKCTTLTSVPVSTPFAPAYSYDFTIREG
ncbi:hypothetical protein J008_07089 [Cryptococcus neoformans]|uniref:Uncharacterized protein n=2 Tax=Cryptococcus neoformans TaxID=5207 RepID=A0A854QHR4_CRYNE|nr:hypothetical protein CNAG_05666 [Cryptococcus neoformans var. grubii H99]OWT35490.1 hypothetical protein C362_07059 [Cryptococcus neoformans var. grubii Bt1]OWZ25866.1 hypothetical protein C353_07121 [Cryptococcus neoformans var. grubii AD1-83a]OWZ26040.1 hypothetical protein C347_07009 [Cryptococcus neoformans var. grubii AD2-60a]OWZ38069.1 hypothetical protein C343_07082 [Cryptococcus neoformans var. grubii C23]OWZ49811.1 hypothetical protein C368_07086 [Cryptococcus neoformans var. grubi|eukprot:XP_012053690.1 hypothetical protein CNAG_05666 [Cryptococcus neoformans var. grubii H99]